MFNKNICCGTHQKHQVYRVPLMFNKNICCGIHQKRLAEALLMNTHNMFSWRNKKNINTSGLRKSILRRATVQIQRVNIHVVYLFVCVEVLRPSQPNGVMSSVVSLPNHTFTGQALSSKRLTSIVHILSPETDNCPS